VTGQLAAIHISESQLAIGNERVLSGGKVNADGLGFDRSL
jgi:hypothetical protein